MTVTLVCLHLVIRQGHCDTEWTCWDCGAKIDNDGVLVAAGEPIVPLFDLANVCPGCHRHPRDHGADCPLGPRAVFHLSADGVCRRRDR